MAIHEARVKMLTAIRMREISCKQPYDDAT
jgi:hypothetical protein